MQLERPDVTLADDNLNKTILNTSRLVLLVFATEWNGACHIMNPIYKALISEYKDRIRIFKIDADKNENTIRAYGIYELPAILFIQNGKVFDHIIGIVSKDVLVANIEKNLKLTACA